MSRLIKLAAALHTILYLRSGDEALVAAQAALDLDPSNEAGLRMFDRLAVVSVPVD